MLTGGFRWRTWLAESACKAAYVTHGREAAQVGAILELGLRQEVGPVLRFGASCQSCCPVGARGEEVGLDFGRRGADINKVGVLQGLARARSWQVRQGPREERALNVRARQKEIWAREMHYLMMAISVY